MAEFQNVMVHLVTSPHKHANIAFYVVKSLLKIISYIMGIEVANSVVPGHITFYLFWFFILWVNFIKGVMCMALGTSSLRAHQC